MQHMRLFVGSQVAGLSEALLTARVVALVGLFTCMRPQMCSEVEVEGKGFPAELALEGLFSLSKRYSVYQHMSAQLGVVEEFLAAALHWADELALPVGHGVLAERPTVCEHLAAAWNVAGVRFLLSRVVVLARVGSLFYVSRHSLCYRRPVLVLSSLLCILR